MLGIIGFGFVGRAIHHGFGLSNSFRVYDSNPKVSVNTLEETVKDSEFIFVCVPTPSDIKTGEIDLGILESVLIDCEKMVSGSDKIFIVKSTVVPGSMAKLQKQIPGLNLVHSPEFLTERNYRFDFINQSRLILGGERKHTNRIEKLFNNRFGYLPVFHCRFEVAELVKYASNCFFSVKVSFCNEMYQVCEALGISYEEVNNLLMLDGRIGHSHNLVPGTDGKMGFGGKCFPKDLCAMIARAEELGVDPKVMKAAWEKNLELRPEHDWEQIKGAIS